MEYAAKPGVTKTETSTSVAPDGVPFLWVVVVGLLLGVVGVMPGGYQAPCCVPDYSLIPMVFYVPVLCVFGTSGGFLAVFIGALVARIFNPMLQWYHTLFRAGLTGIMIGWLIEGDRPGILGVRKWVYVALLWIVGVVWFNLYPWYVPGHDFLVSIGFSDPPQPLFMLSGWVDYSCLVVIVVFGRKLIPEWIRGEDTLRLGVATGLVMWGCFFYHLYIWGFYVLQFGGQHQLIMILYTSRVPVERLILVAVGSVIGAPLIREFRKSGSTIKK